MSITLIGCPWLEAKDCLYIVRVREQQDGSLSLVLAAKQLKEAKEVS